MWIFNGELFDEELANEFCGFVYLVTCKTSGKQYVGKKLFWQTKRKQIKGKRKRIKVSSDWRTYWSSSDDLKKDVKRLGEDSFIREILHLCKGKGELNYLEAREQFDRRVLEYPSNWYNGWIMCRVTSSHVKVLHKP